MSSPLLKTILSAFDGAGSRWFGRYPYRRFAVLGHARTGSNYLSAGISQLDGVRMHHEVFAGENRKTGENVDSILSDVFCAGSPAIKAVGFKVFYYHLTDDEWTRFKQSNMALIHLTRKNRLRTITSLDIAFATNQWLVTGPEHGQTKPCAIRLDPDTIPDRIRRIETMENEARERFRRHSLMECTYEDFVLQPEKTFHRLVEFLGLEGCVDTKAINLIRQNPQPLSALIENYDEISKVLKPTAYSTYLSD